MSSTESYVEYRLTWEYLNPNYKGQGPYWMPCERTAKTPLVPEDVTTMGYDVRNAQVVSRKVEVTTVTTEWEPL